jgi:hypothetical protein
MTPQLKDTTPQEPTLVGMKTALNLVFPDSSSRPSFRAWSEWKAKGYFPSVKIGRRVFVDPVKARQALEARFTIHAN